MNTPSETFCILPWMHLATNSTGNLRVCCNSTPDKNYIYRSNGTIYKLNDADASDFWHSDTLKTIRQQMLAGQRPSICERCFREEDAGLRSARMSWNDSWGYDDNFTDTPPETIKYFDVRLGNLCNLRCRMCNPYASNQWIDEWNLVESKLSDSEHNRLKNVNWFDNDQVWDNIAKYADSIEEIYLTGGEPTLALSQYRLFDKLISLGLSKNIRLKYNTNLTNIPPRMLDYWNYFKKVKINASVDAYGDLNRYIRYPTNWKLVEKNLAIFDEMQKDSRVTLQIHITVQMYNILHLDKLFDYLIDRNFTDIYLNILNHPSYLNIRTLPLDLKLLASQRLEKYIKIKKVSGLISYMNSEDWSNNINKFIQYTKTLDSSRGEDCRTVSPEVGRIVYAQ